VFLSFRTDHVFVPTGRRLLLTRNRYHCLFCDGYEDRGAASAGVLVSGDVASAGVALHMARMAKRLSDKVTIYSNGDEEVSSELSKIAADAGFAVETRRVVRLEKDGGTRSGIVVHLEDGTMATEGFLVSTTLQWRP